MSDNVNPRSVLAEHSFINFSSPQFKKKALIAVAVTSVVVVVVGSMGLGGVAFLAALAIPTAIHFVAVFGGAGAFTLSFVGIRKLFHQDKNKNLEIDQKLQAATPKDKTQNVEIERKLQAANPQEARAELLLLKNLFSQNFYVTNQDLNKNCSSDLPIDRNFENQLKNIKSEKLKNALHLELWKFQKLKAYLKHIETRTNTLLLDTDLQKKFKSDITFKEVRENTKLTSENIKQNLQILHNNIALIHNNIKKEEGYIIGNLKLLVKKILNEEEIEKTLREIKDNSKKEREELELSDNIEYVIFKQKDFLPILDAFTKEI